jgi:hypothetical protein
LLPPLVLDFVLLFEQCYKKNEDYQGKRMGRMNASVKTANHKEHKEATKSTK